MLNKGAFVARDYWLETQEVTGTCSQGAVLYRQTGIEYQGSLSENIGIIVNDQLYSIAARAVIAPYTVVQVAPVPSDNIVLAYAPATVNAGDKVEADPATAGVKIEVAYAGNAHVGTAMADSDDTAKTVWVDLSG
jgi:hypothetical protein